MSPLSNPVTRTRVNRRETIGNARTPAIMHAHVRYRRVLHYRQGPKLRGRTYTFVRYLPWCTIASRFAHACRSAYECEHSRYSYRFAATGSPYESRRSCANTAERREAGCRAPRQMRLQVSIASVLQRNWSVICVRAGPVVTLLFSLSLVYSSVFNVYSPAHVEVSVVSRDYSVLSVCSRYARPLSSLTIIHIYIYQEG